MILYFDFMKIPMSIYDSLFTFILYGGTYNTEKQAFGIIYIIIGSFIVRFFGMSIGKSDF
jgi:ABC-type phosphate transport system permease subunit